MSWNSETKSVHDWLVLDDDGEYVREMVERAMEHEYYRHVLVLNLKKWAKNNLHSTAGNELVDQLARDAMERVDWFALADEFLPKKIKVKIVSPPFSI